MELNEPNGVTEELRKVWSGGYDTLNYGVLERRKTLIEIRDEMKMEEMQKEILAWSDSLASEVGGKSQWREVVEAADKEMEKFLTVDNVGAIENRVDIFLELAHPGHDKGHFLRDRMVGTLLVAKDPFISRGSLSEKVAAFYAAYLHDFGSIFAERYAEKNLGAGHAEVGGWVIDQLLADLVPDGLRKMICYAIVAHTHYLGEEKKAVPDGYVRRPYWDELWQDGDKWYGLPIRVARLSDRGDMLGPIHAVRHILAVMHASQNGGHTSAGTTWVEMSMENLKQWMSPVVRSDWKEKGASPSTMEWMEMYMKSAEGESPYSKDDYHYPYFGKIVEVHAGAGRELMEIVKEPRLAPADLVNETKQLADIEATLMQISRSYYEFPEVWRTFKKVWSELPVAHKAKWVSAFGYIRQFYFDYLSQVSHEVGGVVADVESGLNDDRFLKVLAPTLMGYFEKLR